MSLAVRMAKANPNIRAAIVEASEYPDLVRKYRISGVPKTVVNDEVEVLGALPEAAFVQSALQPFVSPESGKPGAGSDAGG